MIGKSFWGLINRTENKMTEERHFLHSWEHRNIKLKGLIELGFPLPYYRIYKERPPLTAKSFN